MEPLGRVVTVLLAIVTTATAVGTPGGCEADVPTKKILCHINNAIHPATNPCMCTHIVVHDTGLLNQVEKFKLRNKRLKILTRETNADVNLKRGLDGVYLKLDKPPIKGKLNDAIKALAISLDNAQSAKRARAKYQGLSLGESDVDGLEIFMELPPEPQKLTKHYDIKALAKYINYFVVPSENLTDATEHGLAYHPSRLMGIDDILNADSLVDLLSGLGVEHDKLIMALPAYVLQFKLKNAKKNMPRDPVVAPPSKLSQAQFCKIMEEGGWTLEREEDMTAPYAYKGTDWMAFDDSLSTSIKAKYILLRDLAGLSVVSSEHDDWTHSCTARPLLDTIHYTFTNLARKSRAAQLLSLQDQIHNSILPFGADVHLSPYRIVRVVDRAGAVHIVRKEAKTEFQCSRQGFFTHPSGCNRFYRCVKFNQYSSDFTVFEYDCPAGLAFDEKYEVCVWPGSLRDASPCKGSSEIAPVPRNRFSCSTEGYFADPENCRWFFACLDHQRDGLTPPTAYEFRCPFGLVFDNSRLVCDWPWKVPGCGTGHIGVISSAALYPGDILEGRLRPAYADLSDVHVSGGRISGVQGGLVLGTTLLSGIAEQNAGAYATGVDASGNLRGPSYSLGRGSINVAAGDHSGQYVEDNSGAYIHDPTGDTGGEYKHEGEYSARYISDGVGGKLHTQNIIGTVYDSNNLASVKTGGSGAYIHDNRGDAGGVYSHDGFAGLSRGGLAQGTTLIGGIPADRSGAYVHDVRGDSGGAYVHDAVLKTAVGTGADQGGLYVPGGSVVRTGSILTGGNGAYVPDTRGDSGGAYVYSGGLNVVPGISGAQKIYTTGSAPGTVISQGGLVGSRGHIAGISTLPHTAYLGTSGGYVHDSGAVTGLGPLGLGTLGPQGIAVGSKTSSLLGPKLKTVADINLINRGVYVHDSSGDYGEPYIHDSAGDYDSTYYGGKYVVGSGAQVKASLYGEPRFGVPYAGGAYVHDLTGDYGGGYYHPGFKTYFPASTYGIKVNQANLYQPSAPVVHTYEATRLSAVQPAVRVSPITVSNVPSVPLKSVQYIQPAIRPVVSVSTPSPQLVGYHYEGGVRPSGSISHLAVQPSVGKIQPVILSTPATPVVKSQTVIPLTVSGTPATGVSNVHLVKPVQPVVTYGHHPGSTVITQSRPISTLETVTASPLSIVKTPVNTVQYVRPSPLLTASQTLQSIGTEQRARPITVTSSPIVPLNPVQYVKGFVSTPATPVVNYSYKQPEVRPLAVNVPAAAPVLSYSYQQPLIRTQTVRPITVSSTPVVPLNPVQYVPSGFVSTPATPIISSYKQSVVRPVGVNVPAAPLVSYQQPYISTQTVRPVAVSGTPFVPHKQDIEVGHISTPSPPLVHHAYNQQPIIKTQTILPVSVSNVPAAPALSLAQPFIRTQTVRPITVSSTPVVPFSPVQYAQKQFFSTPAPPVVSYSYRQHVPVSPAVSVGQPIIETQTVRPIAVAASPVVPVSGINYGQRTIINTPAVASPVALGAPGASFVQQPLIRTQTVRPITVSSTPVVPFSPVQYAQKQFVSTPAAPVVSYSYRQHVPVSPAVSVSQPVIETQTVRPVVAPASPVIPVGGINYGQGTVISTPAPAVVSPVALGAPGASFVQQPFIRTQTVRPITVSSTPVVPFSPVQYAQKQFVSTPAAPVSYSYRQHVPVSPAVSVGQPVIETQTVRPIAVPASPIVPVGGINYGQRTVISTPASAVVSPVALGAPGASFVQQPFIRTQTVRPITVSSTPVVPFSPVQYAQKQFVSTPAPPVVRYSYRQHVPVSPAVSVSQPVIETQTVRPVVVPASPIVPVGGINYGQRTVISTPAPTVVSPVALGAPGASFVQQPFIRTQTVRPITVSSTPVVPFSPVQYAQKQFVSTPAAPVVSYSYRQHVPVSPAVSVGQPVIETQTVRPVVAPASPVIPVGGINYGQRTVISTAAPAVVSPVALGAPGASFVQQPFFRTQTVRPITVSSTPVVPFSPVQYAQKQFVSTPAAPVVSYSYRQHVPVSPAVSVSQPVIETQTVRPVVAPASPVIPVGGINYGQRTVISTPAPAVVSPVALGAPGASFVQQPFIRTQTVRPITVSSTPVVPFSPVQYAQKQFVSTPAAPVVSYSYRQHVPVSPAVSVSQPVIETQTVRPVVAPASPVIPVGGINYGQRTVISTPAPAVVSPVALGAPGASFVQQPFIRTQTVRPITVSSTPVVPFSPVQYAQKQFVSTPAAPVVSYSYRQHVPVSPAVSVSQPVIETQTVRPVVAPASPVIPVGGINYSQRTVISTPAPAVVSPVALGAPGASFVQQPFIRTQTVRPVTVSSTPVVPVSPVVSVGQHETIIGPAQQPSQVYCASCSVTQTARPITVTSTPIVPLNSVQYVKGSVSPTGLPVASYSYKQQVPVAPVSYAAGPPVIHTQTVRPVTVSSTVATPIVSYQQPVIKTQTVSPIVVSSSPTVPLSPVQYAPNAYVSTPSPPVVSYTYQKPVFKTHPIQPVVLSSPAPFIESHKIAIQAQTVAPIAVTSQVPLSPVQYVTPKVPIVSYQQPVSYSYPKPAIKFETPLKAITAGPGIQPVVSYSYPQPDIKTQTLVTSTPGPLDPIQYVRPVQPKPIFSYSFEKQRTQQPVVGSSPALVSYQQPIKTPATSIRPVVVTTPAPTVLSYKQPVINAQTVSPITVTSTPLSPVQYVRPIEPKLSYTYSKPQPFTVSTPAPPVVGYQQPVQTPISISTPSIPLESVSYQQPITVSSTPVVPLSPVHYGKPAVSFSYVKPLPDLLNTVKLPIASHPQTFIKSQTIKPIVSVTTPAPTTVTYTQQEPLINIVSQTPSVVSYQPIVQKTVSPITVTSTPAVPLKEIQYIKPAEPKTILNYNYEQQPAITFTSQVPVTQEKTIVTSQPAIAAIQPVVRGKPSVGTYFEEYFESNKYQKPVGAAQGAGFINTPVSSVLLPEVSTVRPAVNLPLSIDTVQTVPVGVAEEDLNVHFDVQKVGLPIVTTSTPQQVVEVTTAAPILKKVRLQGGGSRGGYYVRKPVKVQPLVTTTENYPAFYTSTVKPVYSSTIDLTSPTLYSTTVTPSTTTVGDYAIDVEGDIDDTSLLGQVSGGFGEIINAGGVGIIREGVSSTTVSSLKDGEAVVGVIKKEREPLTGRKKTKVVVVSRLSDFNPLLVGKLGAVCSCKTDTKTLDLTGTQGELFRPEPSREYLPTSSAPLSQELTNFDYNDVNPSIVEIKPVQKTQNVFTTTTAVPLTEGTVEYKTTARPSRRIDAQIDCQRPGLFRHPHLCNKFYSCDWDQKKKRFTVNVFNCPIHLAFDSKLGACNWPSKGPACSDNNLLV